MIDSPRHTITLSVHSLRVEMAKAVETIDTSKEIARIKADAELNSISVYCEPSPFFMGMLMSVIDLGKLMLMLNEKDFSLSIDAKENTSYKFLKRPESFRASLVQVVHSERETFNSTNRTMRIIGNDARRIPQIFENVFRLLETPANRFTALHLKTELDEVQKIAKESESLCEMTSTELNNVIEILEEIQTHLTASKTEYAKRCSEAKRDEEEAEKDRVDLEEQLKQMQQEIEKNKDDLDKYHNEMQNNSDQSAAKRFCRYLAQEFTKKFRPYNDETTQPNTGEISAYGSNAMQCSQSKDSELEILKDGIRKAEERAQELFEKRMKIKDGQAENRKRLVKIKQEKTEYDQINELLPTVKKPLNDSYTGLVTQRDGWLKLVDFLQNIGERVRQAVEWSDKLVDVTGKGEGDTLSMEYKSSMKKIYEWSYESVAFAEMIFGWCSAYTCIANTHITPIFDEVVGYLTYENPADVSSKLNELDQMAKQAQNYAREQMNEINRKFSERKEKIQRERGEQNKGRITMV